MCKVSTTPVLLYLLFFDVTLCILIDGCQNAGWNFNILTWSWKQMVSPTCWYLPTTLGGITSQYIIITNVITHLCSLLLYSDMPLCVTEEESEHRNVPSPRLTRFRKDFKHIPYFWGKFTVWRQSGLPPCQIIIYFRLYYYVHNVSGATQSPEGSSTHRTTAWRWPPTSVQYWS